MCEQSDWHNLYSGGWQNIIVPEAFSHPAKFSRKLIEHIYEHAVGEGWLREGDTVLDPFGGVALGAWPALRLGLNFVGVELERPFCDMGGGCDCTGMSRADWVQYFGRWERVRYKDGRHWCPRCLAEAKVVVEQSGQPRLFEDAKLSASYVRNSGKIPHTEPHHFEGNLERWAKYSKNGATAVLLQGDSRELASVLSGQAEACVASPPWMNSQDGAGVAGPSSGMWKGYESGFRSKPGGKIYQSSQDDYGSHPANLGNMPAGDVDACIASPPYVHDASTGALDPSKLPSREGWNNEAWRETMRKQSAGYGQSDGQLAAMPEGEIEAVVSSPPWEETSLTIDKKFMAKVEYDQRAGSRLQPGLGEYGSTEGQLGNSTGTTFWSAARQIVQQVYQVLKPGGYAIFVTKRFVRDKKIVEFSQQWCQLCESVGFELLHWHKAWLVESRGAQYTLGGGLEKRIVKRFSFFRRLHAQKYPHLEIQWEDILCFRKC